MSVCYAHVGYPKCASTALQAGFFSKHPQLFHLGANAGGRTAPYRSDELREIIEIDMRLFNRLTYRPDRVREVIGRHWREFEASERAAFGLSSESFTMHMGFEADAVTKAERLREAMGPDCRILILVREQLSLLASLYREFIKSGLALTYPQYLESVWINQAHSVLAELDYAQVVEVYQRLFGRGNVLVLPYEVLRDHPAEALGQIAGHLGVRDEIHDLRRKNKGPGDAQLEHMRRLNLAEPSGLGGHMLEPLNLYRAPEYLARLGSEAVDSASGLAAKMADKKQRARNAERQMPDVGLDYTVPDSLRDHLTSYFAPGNRRLEDLLGRDLLAYGYAGTGQDRTAAKRGGLMQRLGLAKNRPAS